MTIINSLQIIMLLRYDVLTPVRGLIFDRDSSLIVSNIPSYNLMIILRRQEMDTISLCSLLDINITDFKNTFNEIKRIF